MKKIIEFIFFLLLSIILFFISNYFILNTILIFIIFANILIKTNINKLVKYNLALLPFILLVGLINGLALGLNDGILGVYRLFLVCNTTYVYSNTITVVQFSKIIEKIFYPIKIFKINPKDIGLIVAIGLTFIPILKDEVNNIKNVINLKGMKINIKSIPYILNILFASIFRRIDDMEISLKLKCYEA